MERTYVLDIADGRNEPIKDLDNAKRLVLVDKDTVGAKMMRESRRNWG